MLRTVEIDRLTAVVIAAFMLPVQGRAVCTRACSIQQIMDDGAVVGTGSVVTPSPVGITASHIAGSDRCAVAGSVTRFQKTLHHWCMQPLGTIYSARSIQSF